MRSKPEDLGVNHVAFYMEEPSHEPHVHKFKVRETDTAKHKIEVDYGEAQKYQT